MLKYFSVLYAGHVLEGDGIDFDGVPANTSYGRQLQLGQNLTLGL
jgi:hypothetical protein